MKRRDFLAASVAGGMTLRTAPRSVTAAPPGVLGRSQAVEVVEATVGSLREGLEAGRWTSRAITEAYLARIEAIDRGGPAINSVIEVNPDALTIADGLDAERRAGRSRGPLHGIPVLIKDNIDTADRMQTTAGSLALAGSIAPRDAFIVERLRAAGMILLGKTNLSEWANFRSSTSSSGWSARGGQTRNPHVLDRTPCGSSAGSGAAAAASLATLTIGTETDGSILCPSSVGGIVGIKPTVGLWSRSGIIPISHTQDTAGPMCRTVTDAALLLGALVGIDPRDGATAASRGRAAQNYSHHLLAEALRGARIGVMRKHMGVSAKVERLYDEALAALRTAGAVLVDPVDFADPATLGEAEWEVLGFEFKAGVEAYLATLGNGVPHRTLADLMAFNEANRDREMPYFGQETFEMAARTGTLRSPRYRTLLATCRRLARTEGLDARLATRRLDAIVGVTAGPAWPIDLVNGDRFTGGSTTWSAVAGYPSITVPMGQVQGLPVGLSFMGKAWNEGRLIELAYSFEQATGFRTPPQYRPTVV